MSQIIKEKFASSFLFDQTFSFRKRKSLVDEQLTYRLVVEPIRKWITARRIRELYPLQIIKDDRVLQILCGLK